MRDCARLKSLVDDRDGLFLALRGRATLEVGDDAVDLDLAVASPHYVRAEVSGPMGIKLALFVVNDEWAQFLDLRERVVHRIPFAVFSQDSLRRDQFLSRLPLGGFAPELLVEAALTRSGLPATPALSLCPYSEQKNLYQVVVREKGQLRRVSLDPTSFAPVKIEGFENAAGELSRADWQLRYSEFRGQNWAMLPARVDAYQGQELRWSFRWKEAERWQSFEPEVFMWRPTASMTLKDY